MVVSIFRVRTAPWRRQMQFRVLQGLFGQGKFVGLSSRSHSFLDAKNGFSLSSPPGGEAETSVLIVGAGPVGLSLSILLSNYGIPSLIIERRLNLSKHPQAHFINNRTMEIFRKFDNLAHEIENAQPPVDQWRRFVYCSTLKGPVYGTVDHLRTQDLSREKSPTHVAHFSEHRLLPLLLDRAQKLTAKRKTIRPSGVLHAVHFGHELVSLKQEQNGILATVSCLDSVRKDVQSVRCRYLVGTDGANSFVRTKLGLKMQGEQALQNLVNVHFFSKDLGQLLLSTQPAMLYFIFNSQAVAVVVAHDLAAGEFVAQIPFYPPQQQLEDFKADVCRDFIRTIAGMPQLEVQVETVKQWVMHAQVVENFSSWDQHVLLAGDSAHRFPPAGGFGMNTGIQDAHNLAWKLAAVINGWAPKELLCTYDIERIPVARSNTDLSVLNFQAAMEVPKALGLHPSAARVAHKVVSIGGSWLPERYQRAVLDGIFALGRLQVSESFLNKYNPVAASRLLAVEQILRRGASLQLQFPAEDLGFRYLRGALINENVESEVVRSTGRRCEFLPSSKPGSRLPHMRIRFLNAELNEISETSSSTLDLISKDKVEFILIVGPMKAGLDWANEVSNGARMLRIPLKLAVLWPGGFSQRNRVGDATVEERIAVAGWRRGNLLDVIHVEEDDGNSWWQLCGMPADGALLVRPDEHIAWQIAKRAGKDVAAEVERALMKITGRL